jgi:hypothetical protein
MDGLARMNTWLRTAFNLLWRLIFISRSNGAIMVKKFKWQDLTFGREITYASEFNDVISENLLNMAEKLNAFQAAYGKQLKITSGWRPAAINAKVGGAKRSNHQLGLACDVADSDGAVDKFCMDNLKLLEELGLYLEHPDATVGWCHLQMAPPRSGNRVFRP